jgi:CheY-like chemotaxis protein/anti-sigma regulatory factor (Ser/Thr protein kinase)
MRLKKKKISLIFKPAKNFRNNVIFDKLRLSQILNNLISNAIKFTEKGSVTIKYIIEEDSFAAAYINFIVADTGIGIKPENIEKIKNAFEQENSGISRKYGGTGLGLSIVDQLLIKFDSELQIKSQFGEGSIFYFRLKLQLGSLSEQAFKPDLIISGENNDPINKKILYVEDIHQNQILMKAMTQDFGIELDLASNANECMQLCDQKTYDLILMDIQMPEINSVMCYEMLKAKSKQNKKTPVIAFTANAEESKVNNYKAVGFNDVLTKPIKKQQLYLFLKNFFF